MVLSVNEILNGKNEEIEVYCDSVKDTVMLRRLTQAEIGKIERVEAKALGKFNTTEESQRGGKRAQKGIVRSNAQIDISKQSEASYQAKLLTVAYSLSVNGETITPDAVQHIQGDLFDDILKHARRINRLGDDLDPEELEKEINDFPQDS